MQTPDSLEARVVLVTGATDGIGKATAMELARRGARVIIHGRTAASATAAREELTAATGNTRLRAVGADLASLSAVRSLAEAVRAMEPALHVLVNNAGIYMHERVLTADGYEMTFAVNHLAPFLLTRELLGLLTASAPSRIITVSSVAHQRAHYDATNLQAEKRFDAYGAYALSKLANILFTYELADRLSGTGVTATCLHPGVIRTKMLRSGFPTLEGSPVEDGAATSVFLAADPGVAGVTGAYFVACREQKSSPASRDPRVRKELWSLSERLCSPRAEAA
jgi:NAD(P)-dependent dehydrogenase (short-subunit alcohol dehydrogenase family)